MRSLLVALAALLLPAFARADDPILALMERGHWKAARTAVEALAQSQPAGARTLYLKSRVKLAFGLPDDALPLAERAATLEPKNADYRYQVADVLGFMAQRAGKLKAFGLGRRFKKEAEAALALDPKHLDALSSLVEFYSIAPGIIGGDDRKAAALAEKIATLDPARGFILQAQLAVGAKDEAKAEALYQRAAEATPPSYAAQVGLARFYTADSRKQWDLAEKYARAAVAADRGRVGAYALLAGMFAHLERWDPLDAALADAEREVPGDLTPHYQAARILILDGHDPARAERHLRRYLTVEPEGGSPTWAHAHWRLAQALEKQGKKPEALAELDAALRLKPDLEEAKKDRKRLKRG